MEEAIIFQRPWYFEMVIAWTSATILSTREARSDRVNSQYSDDDTLFWCHDSRDSLILNVNISREIGMTCAEPQIHMALNRHLESENSQGHDADDGLLDV